MEMDIIEQLSLVAQAGDYVFRTVIMWLCLGALGVLGTVIFLAMVCAPVWEKVREFWSLHTIEKVLLGVCIIGFIQYGSTKQGWNISFDGGIKQNPIQPSSVTNNLVSIHWTRDTSGGVYVPTDASVYIDYKPWADTNAVWQTLAETTVGACGWSGTVVNATNYSYNVWAYYIPPEPVHTNGVWIYKTRKDRNDGYAIPLRCRIEVNGKAIATPKEKRKDEEAQ